MSTRQSTAKQSQSNADDTSTPAKAEPSLDQRVADLERTVKALKGQWAATHGYELPELSDE